MLLGLILTPPSSAAGNPVTDLERQLETASPADKPGLWVQLSAAIETDDTTRSWDYAQLARREARTPADEIRADTRIATLLRRKGSYSEALTTARAALDRAIALGDNTLRPELLLVLAHTHVSLGDFPTALERFRELLPLAEQLADARLLSRVYNTLGIAYADSGQPESARQAYETGLTHAKRSGDQFMLASLLNNFGNLAINAGDYPEARRYHEQALALRESLGGDTRGVADSNLNLGEIAMLSGQPAAALPYLDRAISLHTTLGLKRNLTNARLSRAAALRALGRMDEALVELESAHTLADSLGTPITLKRVYYGFSAYHEARGDFRAALDYERKLAEVTEAAVGERSRQRIDTLQTLLETARRDREIAVLRRDQSDKEAALTRARSQRYALLALAILTGVALAAVINRQRFKQRAERRVLAETQAARHAAEQADALKTRLLHMVSHDIRGPVGNVLLLAEDLRDAPPAPVGDDRASLIAHEAQRVLDLAQDLLDAAALESGRLQVRCDPVDLAEIVHATLSRMTMQAGAKEQRLDFTAPAAPEGHVLGDAKRLAQITANLVSNALKFSPPRATVRLAVQRKESRVHLVVQDEGPGVPPESLPHLFRPFSQLSARPTGGESSHGLGLSIVHDLVRLQGGTILVDSSPGRGTAFTVDLPAHA